MHDAPASRCALPWTWRLAMTVVHVLRQHFDADELVDLTTAAAELAREERDALARMAAHDDEVA
jgi:hypothetical protein